MSEQRGMTWAEVMANLGYQEPAKRPECNHETPEEARGLEAFYAGKDFRARVCPQGCGRIVIRTPEDEARWRRQNEEM